MKKALEYILEKLPDHRARIIKLFNEDEDFRIMCEDYLTSANALEECRKNAQKDHELEGEFALIYLELEKEIIHVVGSQGSDHI